MMVADTDVLIDALRGREPSRSVVAGEIEGERRKVERLLAALAVVPLDEAASRAAAEVQRELMKSGARIATADALIAGICLARSAPLLTRNPAHFARVPGLVLQAMPE